MNENPYQPPSSRTTVESAATPIWVYLLCGWPLALVAIGGLIGGLCGGAAFGINLSIWKSSLPLAARLVLIPIVGVAAVAIWFVAVVGVSMLIG